MVPITVYLPADLVEELRASDVPISVVVRDALRAELDRRHRSVTVGRRFATPAEQRVLEYLPTHLTLAEIGERLDLRRTTVKSHVASIYAKLNVSSRSELIRRLALSAEPIPDRVIRDVAV